MTDVSNTTDEPTAVRSGGLLGNMQVKTKIFAGFGTVLVVLAAVASFGYFGFVAVSHDVDHYTEMVEEAALISHIEADFLKLRTHAREFANTGHEEDAKAVHEIEKKLQGMMVEAKKHLVDPQHLGKLEEMQHELGIYIKDFAHAEELEHEFLMLLNERLDPLGAKVIEDIDIIIEEATAEGNTKVVTLATKAREHILLAQLNANILLGREKAEFGVKVERELETVEALMADLGAQHMTAHEKELFDEASTLMHEYANAFHKAHADEKELRELINGEMAHAAQIIVKDAELLQEEIAKLEEEIRVLTMSEIQLAEMEMLIAAAVGVIGALIIAMVLGSMISKPVVAMTQAMGRLADDDLEVDIPAQGRRDEIGKMASAVQVFKDNAIRNKKLEAEAEAQKRRAEEEKKAMMNKMADDFEASVGGIVSAVSAAATEMQSSASSMASISEETSSQATTVAAASEEASSNVQTVASAAEELSSSVSEISRQVAQSTQVASTAVAEVEGANQKVQGLADAAKKIGEVVALITDIADQTNLLALNATIEAARAGEAGKGFAVVASEVKNLANQTAKATEEISNQIGGIQGATEDAVTAIGSIGGIINQMNEIASTIAAAVEEQGAATSEIARNVEQAASGTQEVSSNIQGVNQAAVEAGASSTQVLSAADELAKNSETLNTEVTKFMEGVRAA